MHTQINRHAYKHRHTQLQIHRCICKHTHIHSQIHTHRHAYTCRHALLHRHTDIHTLTDTQTHANTYTQTWTFADTHIYSDTHTHAHTYTRRHARARTHTHIHSEIRVCHRAEGNAARHSACVPSCSELPDPPLLTHSCTPPSLQAIFTAHPLGAWLSPRPWSDTSRAPWVSPTWGSSSPRAAYKHSWEEGLTRAGEAAISQPAGCRRQAAGGTRGPSWQAACGHTWVNRDNGGCSSSPAPFPQAQLRVWECPDCPPPRKGPAGSGQGQLKGTSLRVGGGGVGREACEPIRREGVQRIVRMEL